MITLFNYNLFFSIFPLYIIEEGYILIKRKTSKIMFFYILFLLNNNNSHSYTFLYII
nr:MAG TPA: hypothetical protein [Caudoviricetes sp.]